MHDDDKINSLFNIVYTIIYTLSQKIYSIYIIIYTYSSVSGATGSGGDNGTGPSLAIFESMHLQNAPL